MLIENACQVFLFNIVKSDQKQMVYQLEIEIFQRHQHNINAKIKYILDILCFHHPNHLSLLALQHWCSKKYSLIQGHVRERTANPYLTHPCRKKICCTVLEKGPQFYPTSLMSWYILLRYHGIHLHYIGERYTTTCAKHNTLEGWGSTCMIYCIFFMQPYIVF